MIPKPQMHLLQLQATFVRTLTRSESPIALLSRVQVTNMWLSCWLTVTKLPHCWATRILTAATIDLSQSRCLECIIFSLTPNSSRSTLTLYSTIKIQQWTTSQRMTYCFLLVWCRQTTRPRFCLKSIRQSLHSTTTDSCLSWMQVIKQPTTAWISKNSALLQARKTSSN